MTVSKWLGVVLGVVVLLGAGVLIGATIESNTARHTATEELAASSIGNLENGRALFANHGCSSCHTFLGKGGEDAPALDFMRGQLAARDIANMSGRIWNHVPQMTKHFAAEDIPFPTFEENEMADLVAYLHGGSNPPDVVHVMMKHGGTTSRMGGATSGMGSGSMGR